MKASAILGGRFVRVLRQAADGVGRISTRILLGIVLAALAACASGDSLTAAPRHLTSAKASFDCTPIDPSLPSDCGPTGPTSGGGSDPSGDATYDQSGQAYPKSVFVTFQQDGLTFIGTATIFSTNNVIGQMYTFNGSAVNGEYCYGTFYMTVGEAILLWATGFTDIEDWTITGCR